MPMPKKTLDEKRLRELYNAKLTGKAMGKQLGCSANVVARELGKLGLFFKNRQHHNLRNPVCSEEIKALHNSGHSVLSIARKLGASRVMICDRMDRMGIRARDCSQATKLRMSKMTPAERKALASNARKANLGKSQNLMARLSRAKTTQNICKLSDQEQLWRDRFKQQGIELVPLYAIHVFNIDLAHTPSRTAIEVHNSWHTADSKAKWDAIKLHHLHMHGWAVHYVYEKYSCEKEAEYIAKCIRIRMKMIKSLTLRTTHHPRQ